MGRKCAELESGEKPSLAHPGSSAARNIAFSYSFFEVNGSHGLWSGDPWGLDLYPVG